ncbi:MAG: hypothetical protein ACE5HW_07175 [Candidatus Methanofastidiosia archaeon]
MDLTELILKIVETFLEISTFFASELSNLTKEFVPQESIDDIAILILLLILRAGFDFTKRLLEILIIFFAIYVFVQILPSIIGLF